MCRFVDRSPGPRHQHDHHGHLDIKSFFLKLSLFPSSCLRGYLPNLLTLVYLPRRSPLQIDGFNIRPDAPGFVTLHRVVGASMTGNGDCMFGSRDLVQVGEGVIFEVYMGDEKLLKGTYRKGEYSWALEALRMERSYAFRDVAGWIKEAEVYVTTEAGGREVTMREKVKATTKRHERYKGFKPMVVIPEDTQMDDTESDVGRLCFGAYEQPEVGFDGHGNESMSKEIKTEIERLGWAVNFGIWAICLGAGYLVSRASSRSLRHKRVI